MNKFRVVVLVQDDAGSLYLASIKDGGYSDVTPLRYIIDGDDLIREYETGKQDLLIS